MVLNFFDTRRAGGFKKNGTTGFFVGDCLYRLYRKHPARPTNISRYIKWGEQDARGTSGTSNHPQKIP